MKSYILGIVVAMILSAAYALSNTAEITVKFLNLETTFPQGMWEVIVFGCGVLIMWFISVCASIEMYVRHRRKAKELTKRITQLEDERKSLLATLRSFGWKDREEDKTQDAPDLSKPHPKYVEVSDAKTSHYSDPPREAEEKVNSDKSESSDGAESQKNAEARPHFLKTLISSVFKREKKSGGEHEPTEAVSDETEEAQKKPEENVCMIPEPAGEEYDVQVVTETDNKEKSEI